MKKAFAFLSIICLVALVFVSCNSETKLDDTITVRFNASDSRSLSVSNQNLVSVDSTELKWYYHGWKMSDEKFTTGQSGSNTESDEAYWTPLETLNQTVEFSQGLWNFKLKAIRKTDNAQLYSGETNGNVLLSKANEVNTIKISVSPISSSNGSIVFNGVYIDPKNSGEIVSPNKLIIDGVTSITVKSANNPDGFVVGTDRKINWTYSISAGTHTVKVLYESSEEEVIIASEEKTIIVYSGLDTTISGPVEEATTTGKFDPLVAGTTSGNVSSAVNNKLALTVENVTPSMVSGKNTTVTVPTSVLGSSATTATVSVAVKQASEISSNNSFEVEEGNDVAASISLTLKAGETAIANFGSNKVTVETYIETGLSGVNVKYNGYGDAPSDIEYVPATGKLTFKTNHFSEFYVEAEIVAKIGEKGYLTLQKAIDAAKSGETITLVKDCTGSGLGSADGTKTRDSLIIDFNGKKYTMNDPAVGSKGTETQAMHWGKSLGAVTMKNGTFDIVENPQQVYMGMQNYIDFTAENMTFDFRNIPVTRYGENEFEGNWAIFNGKECSMFNNNSGSCMTLKGCTVIMPEDSEVGIYAGEKGLLLEDCTITGSVNMQYLDSETFVKTKGTTTISKGVVEYFGYKVKTSEEDGYTVYTNPTAVNVSNTIELTNAINQNSKVTVRLAKAGTYELPQMRNTEVSIIGTKDTVIDMKNKVNEAKSISFEGVTVNFGTDNYCGFQHTGKLTYRDCTITGLQFLYANEVEFNNCLFVQDIVDYNVWTYGASNVLFKDCTFNCRGKSVLIYIEGGNGQTVNFENCKFNATEQVEGKAAIEIDSSLLYDNGIYTVIIDQATANNVSGFSTGSVSNNSVWNNKKGDKATVIVAGNTVLSASSAS